MLSLFIACLILASATAVEIPLTGSPALAYAAPSPVYTYSAPTYGSAQYRAQDTFGQYSFAYATDNGIKQSETRHLDGNVAGGYSYTSPEGQKVSITYTAGQDGFQATGDTLPQATTRSNQDAKETEKKPETYKSNALASTVSLVNPFTYIPAAKPTLYASANPTVYGSPAYPYAYVPLKTGHSYSYHSPTAATGNLFYYNPGFAQRYYVPQF